MIVVDASVAVKWVTGEEHRETANALLAAGDEIMGPALLRIEVASALARKARFHEITADDASAALDLWVSMIHGTEVTLFDETQDLARALKLSRELNHPLQDCVYLALAERIGVDLITADEKFVAKTRRRHARVRSLKSLHFGPTGANPSTR